MGRLLRADQFRHVSLVLLAWGVLLALQGRRRFGLGVVAGAAAWFVLATQVAIPAFGGNLDFYSERFGGDRGASLGSVFVSFVTDPLTTLGDAATAANAKVLLSLVLVTAGLALLAFLDAFGDKLRLDQLPAVEHLATRHRWREKHRDHRYGGPKPRNGQAPVGDLSQPRQHERYDTRIPRQLGEPHLVSDVVAEGRRQMAAEQVWEQQRRKVIDGHGV